MEKYKNIQQRIRKLPFDLKAEAVVAELVDAGYELENFLIIPEGEFRRAYRPDILRDGEIQKYDNFKNRIVLRVCRENLYHSLPEAFTQRLKKGKESTAPDKFFEEKNKETENASVFFSVLENEFYKQRAEVEINERKILNELQKDQGKESFQNICDTRGYVIDERTKRFFRLIPFFHKISQDIHVASACIQYILDFTVKINFSSPQSFQVHESLLLNLGDQKMGVDFVLGDKYESDVRSIEVILGPLSCKDAQDYLPEKDGMKFLDLLYSYFLPVEAEIITQVELEDKEMHFTLNECYEDLGLGFTTALA